MRSILKALICGLGSIVFCSAASGQTTWKRTFGGFSVEEGHSIRELPDSGFVVCGSTGSFGDGGDVYLLKLDSLGEREWSRAYGSIQADQGWAAEPVASSGYVIAGSTNTGSFQSFDGLLMMVDGIGDPVWSKTIGTLDWDFFYDVQVLSDGYIMTGKTYGYSGGIGRTWIVRTDLAGDTIWTSPT